MIGEISEEKKINSVRINNLKMMIELTTIVPSFTPCQTKNPKIATLIRGIKGQNTLLRTAQELKSQTSQKMKIKSNQLQKLKFVLAVKKTFTNIPTK